MAARKLTTLKKNKEFGYVYRRGAAVRKRHFTMIYVKSRYGGVRVGFQTSKKVGGSVARNRARRRIKEACREIFAGIDGNYSIVFVIKQSMVNAGFAEITGDVSAALKKALTAGKSRT